MLPNQLITCSYSLPGKRVNTVLCVQSIGKVVDTHSASDIYLFLWTRYISLTVRLFWLLQWKLKEALAGTDCNLAIWENLFYTFGYIQECFRFQMYWSKHLWSKITHMHKALLLGVFLLVVCTCTVDIYIYIHLWKLLNARLKNGFLQCWIMRDVRMEGELEFYEGL